MPTQRWAVTQSESVHFGKVVRHYNQIILILLTVWTKITADIIQSNSAMVMHSTLRPVSAAQSIAMTR